MELVEIYHGLRIYVPKRKEAAAAPLTAESMEPKGNKSLEAPTVKTLTFDKN